MLAQALMVLVGPGSPLVVSRHIVLSVIGNFLRLAARGLVAGHEGESL